MTDPLTALSDVAEIGSFIGLLFFSWLTWASGYMSMLWAAAKVHGWGFRRSPLPPPEDSGFDWDSP